MLDETFYHATYPIDPTLQERLSAPQVTVQMGGARPALGQLELIHAGEVTGQPGYDYQNPAAFLNKLVIVSNNFEFDYARTRADTPAQVAANVAAGGSVFDLG